MPQDGGGGGGGGEATRAHFIVIMNRATAFKNQYIYNLTITTDKNLYLPSKPVLLIKTSIIDERR